MYTWYQENDYSTSAIELGVDIQTVNFEQCDQLDKLRIVRQT